MSLTITPLEAFEKDFKHLFKKYPSLISDIRTLKESLLENPQQGTPFGKDLYKIRMAIRSKGKGKSGGTRVITYIKIVAETIFLIAIYDKSEFEDISEKELAERLKTLE
jgi:mRNA-degrading endonuclease RelE of RelBE toxin-antitoxin system